MRIAVTGGSGKLGRTVVRELRAAGDDVIALDATGERGPGFVRVDLTDYGQTVDAILGIDGISDGFDAIVHLAAIPAPGILSDVATFHNNIRVTYNVFQAARRAGIRNIVYASSETVLGLPFDVPPPYIPVDEEYPARPESTYSLVKHLEEQMAIELVRWDPELKIVALRFSNVMDPSDYAEFPSFDQDAQARKWNLWGYIDARDGAQAIRRALEWKTTGFDRFIIAAADTVMSRPNEELIAEVFPGGSPEERIRGQRHAPVDRQGKAAARLRAAAFLARRGLRRVALPPAQRPGGMCCVLSARARCPVSPGRRCRFLRSRRRSPA